MFAEDHGVDVARRVIRISKHVNLEALVVNFNAEIAKIILINNLTVFSRYYLQESFIGLIFQVEEMTNSVHTKESLKEHFVLILTSLLFKDKIGQIEALIWINFHDMAFLYWLWQLNLRNFRFSHF